MVEANWLISTQLQLPSDSALLRHSILCLKAVSCALGPECLVPSLSQLNTMCNCSTASYEPRTIDTSRINLCQDLRTFVYKFATYWHDCYSYEKVRSHFCILVPSQDTSCNHLVAICGMDIRTRVFRTETSGSKNKAFRFPYHASKSTTITFFCPPRSFPLPPGSNQTCHTCGRGSEIPSSSWVVIEQGSFPGHSQHPL